MNIRMPSEKRKLDIEQAAMQLAFKVGPAQVTTGMIAAELGLTQPAIYKHFSSKDAIWIEISKRLSLLIGQNVARAQAADCRPDARLRMLALDHLQLINAHPAMPEFMIMRDTKDGHIILQDTIQAMITKYRAALTANVRAAVRDGIFSKTIDPDDAASLIFGVIQSLVLRMVVSRNPEVLIIDGARLLDLQLAGFLPRGDE